MAKKEIGVELDLLLNKIRNAIIVSALEKSKLSTDDTVARLSFVDLLKESNVALALEEFNIYCRDNGGTTQAYMNGLAGFIDIFGSDSASLDSGGFTTIGGGVVDIQSDNNISIIANGTDVVIQSSVDAVIIDGALGITFFNGGGTSPVRSDAQFVVGTSLTALNAWISSRNGSVSRAAHYIEPQVNYTGTNQPGLFWNSSVSRAFIEQQLIGNKTLSGVLGASTGNSNTVGNTAIPTNITGTGYTYSLPANSQVVGKRLRVTFRGRYSTGAGGPQVNLRLQAGSNTMKLVNVQLQANQTSRGFHGQAFMTFAAIGAGGQVNASINAFFDSANGILSGGINPNISNASYTTLIAQSINLNWQWINNTASSSVTFEDIIFEVLN